MTDDTDVGEVNVVTYVVGYSCRRFLKAHKCEVCRNIFFDNECILDDQCKIFSHSKAVSERDNTFF